MKKTVYEMLTIKNNITLSKEALEYLASVVSVTDLPSIVDELRKEQTPVSIARIKDALLKILDNQNKELRKDLFEIRNTSFKKKSGLAKLQFLKKKMLGQIKPIISLKDGLKATIFGEYHVDNMDREVLEDDQGMVALDFSQCQHNCFLHESMFLGLRGTLKDQVFYASDILLPRCNPGSQKTLPSEDQSCNFLVFGNFEWSTQNISRLKGIISKYDKIVFIVFVGNLKVEDSVTSVLETYKDIFFIFSPSKYDQEETFLPRKMALISKKTNLISATNPFEVQAGTLKVGIVMDDVFGAKTHGRYLGGSHLESFVHAYLSQYSFNPFGSTDLSFEEPFDIVIVLQKSLSCILKRGNVCFASISCSRYDISYLSYCSGELSLIKL